jgi:ABC-type branched-subunit amino acid transport system substrate-binding protein
MAKIGRYSQLLDDPKRNPVKLARIGNGTLSGAAVSTGPVKQGFGRRLNPVGNHLNFAQPPRSAIIGETTIRTAPAYMGAQLHQYGLKQAPAPGALYTQQFIKKLVVALDNQTSDVFYPISGTIFWYMTSTNATDQVLVRIGDLNADQLPFGPGNGIEGLSFNKVYISIPTGIVGAKATFVYFTDDPNAPARFF